MRDMINETEVKRVKTKQLPINYLEAHNISPRFFPFPQKLSKFPGLIILKTVGGQRGAQDLQNSCHVWPGSHNSLGYLLVRTLWSWQEAST